MLTEAFICVAVGIGLELAYRVLGKLMESCAWYNNLGKWERQRLCRRLVTVLHHLYVSFASLYFLSQNDERGWRRYVFSVEVAYDIVDSISDGVFSGMSGLPLLLHHGTALGMEYIWLSTSLEWSFAAQLCSVLLGTGAVDIFMMKVMPRTPLATASRTFLPMALSVAQFLLFVGARCVYFSRLGFTVVPEAFEVSAAVGYAMAALWVFMSAYHVMLGVAMLMSIANGGTFPSLVRPGEPLYRADYSKSDDDDDDESEGADDDATSSDGWVDAFYRFGASISAHRA
jgi:hypothetical protein